jgi:hypothetical protein
MPGELIRRDFGEVLYVSPAPAPRGARGRARAAAGLQDPERRRRDLGYPRDHALDERLRRLRVGQR